MIINVNLPNNPYDIVIEQGVLDRAEEELDLNRKVLVVTDSLVPDIYAKKIAQKAKFSVMGIIKPGEEHKSMESFMMLEKLLLDNGFTRKDCVVAVGGGIVGDLAGYVASSYMRGIDFYNIPTTVLSQVDSSVGGKTGLNFGGVKNILGAFWQPKKVLIDTTVLSTLSKRQISNGLAEAVKMFLTFDREMFEKMEQKETIDSLLDIEETVADAIKIKVRVVEQDEREAGLRKVLNFGHTLGHGIEMSCGGKLYHGECVGIGMLAMCSDEVRPRIFNILTKLHLPTECDIDIKTAMNAVSHDKKSSKDGISTVYVSTIGEYELRDMSLSELEKRLNTVINKAFS